ncbi:nitrite/sulfite reductase [Dyadobacter sp. CY261]|uniref:nitrite/sulfite reductase n=1 Tax=Dyadobacter sp. CY261 TaxID=2907203 RepID=UPI001F287970|nr:nitrite/sulfite reductase [Dyadobacter sp. CY261]MCF0074928.1 nitrite/sulfite reductase [Dyadobacter sp. CY261]
MALTISERVHKKAVRDIIELDTKIKLFQAGKLDNESFRAFRLTRGVYGQRQPDVNMIRIKLPFGRVTPAQLIRIAELSDRYGSGNLHATTRQDIQLHYVKLADAPQLWADLEDERITLREACGNTIRNLTASPYAGIDPDEPFDVSPYANAVFNYFLRNPVCQQLGRKFKIAFSSSEKDSAFTFIHDMGFIPKIKSENGLEVRGFKIVMAGGLGAQPFLAHPVFDFMEENQIIPFTEACLRIFDRYGERAKRHKARLKYLINDIGIERFLELVNEERKAISSSSNHVNLDHYVKPLIPKPRIFQAQIPSDPVKYLAWRQTNVTRQKQKETFFSVQIKVTTGDLSSDLARKLAKVIDAHASDDIRITVNQGFLCKYVREQALISLFNELNEIGLAEPGFDTLADITACPGTDTCNLAIASSTGLARVLENTLQEEFPDILFRKDIKIKISGCMNGCGHHAIANIGFHAMSMKAGKFVLPAMQVMLAGGPTGDGSGRMAEKIIKIPSRKAPDAMRTILNDFRENAEPEEMFNSYYLRFGKNYFYNLLKPLGEISEITQLYLTDWGAQTQYETLIGIGECAVPMIDMVSVVIDEARETAEKRDEAYSAQEWVESIYYSYNVFLGVAKALLLTKDMPCNTQFSILNNFDKTWVETGELSLGFEGSFKDKVLEINKVEPSVSFATTFREQSEAFRKLVIEERNAQLLKQ